MMSMTAVPPSLTGTWVIDPVHSRVGFAVKHLGINWVRGRFDRFEGTLEIPDSLSTAIASGAIDGASVDTRFTMRDEHLRSRDFFDVENHSTITFASTAITPLSDDRFEVAGRITIRGVTKPLTLEGQVNGTALDQYGNARVGLDAAGYLRRSDFGMPYNETTAGIPIVADEVKLMADVEAIKQPDRAHPA